MVPEQIRVKGSARSLILVWNFRGFVNRFLGILGLAAILQRLNTIEQIYSWNWLAITLEASAYVALVSVIIIAYFIGFKAFPYFGFWGVLNKKKMGFDDNSDA